MTSDNNDPKINICQLLRYMIFPGCISPYVICLECAQNLFFVVQAKLHIIVLSK
jgi:hypothetical protein